MSLYPESADPVVRLLHCCYWSYKLLLDTVNDPNWAGWDSWDLGKCVDLGWFPVGG